MSRLLSDGVEATLQQSEILVSGNRDNYPQKLTFLRAAFQMCRDRDALATLSFFRLATPEQNLRGQNQQCHGGGIGHQRPRGVAIQNGN